MIRLVKYACSFGLLLALSAGCSSASTTPPTTVASGIPTTTDVSTTTLAGTIGPGQTQTATGPNGQKVTGTPTHVEHSGTLLGGPKGSWVVGLVVANAGPGAFQSVPATQVALVDTSGRSYPAVPQSTPQTGQPTSIAAGGQLRGLFFFVLPNGVTIKAVEFQPFGASGPTLQWNP